MTDAIRDSRPIIHRSMAERHARVSRSSRSAARPARPRRHPPSIPITFEGRTTGALAVAFDVARDLDEDEVWFLQSLAAQGAQSLERARLFAALQERDERLRFALAASGTGTWTWSLGRQPARLVTRGPASSTGPSPGGRPPSLEAYLDLVHPDDRQRVDAAIQAAVRDAARYDEEFRVVRPDGSSAGSRASAGSRWTTAAARSG